MKTTITQQENKQLLERIALLEKKLQDEKHANMVQNNRLKDEFIANVSHELRTPLNGILGLTEALQEEVYGPLTERQHTALRHIEEGGRQLLGTINDILDLAKMAAGKEELTITAMPIADVCHHVVQKIHPLAQQKSLTVTFNIHTNIHSIHADERRIKHLLTHLLTNAIKFTPDGGSLGLDVTSDSQRNTITLSVWDTGIGIASEHLSILFQPFVQIDSRLAREFSGTGIGLVIVSHIVTMHGGTIRVASESGKGSRFSVELPIHQHAYVASLAPNAHQLTTETLETMPLILLVDDNDDNCMMVADYLEVHGYRVIVAHNGQEAIEHTQTHQPDLILMDVQMPIMDGITATRHIRALPQHHEIPILAVTALALPGDEEACLAAGVNAYISKPVRLQELVRLVTYHLDRVTHST